MNHPRPVGKHEHSRATPGQTRISEPTADPQWNDYRPPTHHRGPSPRPVTEARRRGPSPRPTAEAHHRGPPPRPTRAGTHTPRPAHHDRPTQSPRGPPKARHRRAATEAHHRRPATEAHHRNPRPKPTTEAHDRSPRPKPAPTRRLKTQSSTRGCSDPQMGY